MAQIAVLALALLQAGSGAGPRPAVDARDARTWLAEAQHHFQRQDWERTRQAARKALELDPHLGDAEVLLGLVATAESRFPEAEKHFRNAAGLQPKNPRVHAYLGSTYLQLKRVPEARRAFEEVLQLDGANLSAHHNLGLIALLENQPADALSHFERVHAAEPKDVPALMGVLESQLLLKRSEEAVRSAKKLEALLDPRDP